jgi:predicted nucleotidyltransferase
MTDGSLLYPDPAHLPLLLNDLTAFFSQQSSVAQVFAFGSLARQEWDRWSDLDVLVITTAQREFKPVFAQLSQCKPILHHSFFTLRPNMDGAYVLGNVFVDESVFHCVDLNFLSVAQAQVPDALLRFGPLLLLYSHEPLIVHSDVELSSGFHTEDPTEKRINDAMHFTKKALKKVLRRQGSADDLQARVDYLTTILQDYPGDIVTPGGRIGQLAQTFIDMATLALTDRRREVL